MKFDGYRLQLHLVGGKAIAYTRNGYDWTKRFRSIADAVAELPTNDLVVDGEVVVPGRGSGDIGALQDDLGTGASERFVYHAFDLIHLDGYDLRAVPLIERKRLLGELLDAGASNERLHFVEHIEEDGPLVHTMACRMGLEGVVSKLRDSGYRSGRGETWIKTKCLQQRRFVVVGFDPAPGAIAALRLGEVRDGKLIYAGRVGTGFSRKQAGDIRRTLEPLIRKTTALHVPVRKKTVWVEPRFAAEVEFLELDDDGRVRHSSFGDLAPLPVKRRG